MSCYHALTAYESLFPRSLYPLLHSPSSCCVSTALYQVMQAPHVQKVVHTKMDRLSKIFNRFSKNVTQFGRIRKLMGWAGFRKLCKHYNLFSSKGSSDRRSKIPQASGGGEIGSAGGGNEEASGDRKGTGTSGSKQREVSQGKGRGNESGAENPDMSRFTENRAMFLFEHCRVDSEDTRDTEASLRMAHNIKGHSDMDKLLHPIMFFEFVEVRD